MDILRVQKQQYLMRVQSNIIIAFISLDLFCICDRTSQIPAGLLQIVFARGK